MPLPARTGAKRHPYHRRRRAGRGGARAQANGAAVLGAIDVGTNACRLLIAVPDKRARGSDGQIGSVPRVIDSYTANVRLGESLERTGTITDAALDRTIAALKVCAARLKRRRVTHLKAIATEACRRAANAQDLVRRAEAEAGIHLNIVTPEEEARLAAAGCLQLIGGQFDGALIFDIGGGSTELILVRRNATAHPRHDIVAWSSAPVGVVKLAERHGGRQLTAASYDAMRAELGHIFAAMRIELGAINSQRYHLLGTSGTLTTLAGIKLGLKRYERSRIDGQWLKRDEILKISDRIVTQDFPGRASIPCIGTDRADLILPGCAILSAIMENWPCGTLRVADRGLREGILIALLKESEDFPSTVSACDQGRRGNASGVTTTGKSPSGRGLRVKVRTKGLKASSARWLERQLNDPYVGQAKSKGYRSRAAFKLIELDDKFRFLKPGARVLDLGAAPGGWSQVARRRVGGSGKVVGADIAEVDPIAGVELLTLDLLSAEALAAIRAALQGPADLVLSDMAAPTTGHRATDHLRTVALFEAALDVAEDVLKDGGAFVGKLFQGGAAPALLQRLKKAFRDVRHVKPPASRAESVELYLVALGYRGSPT